MNNTAEVFLWGTRVGILHQEPGRAYASFEYDRDFTRRGVEVSPLRMPTGQAVYEFPTLGGEPFHGLPGLVADSLPDSFGNAVIEHWLSSQGKSLRDFTAIDRLCYTGKRGMGALEYIPAIYGQKEVDAAVNVREMVRFASDILSRRESVRLSAEEELTYSQLLQIGTSAGGARAKALISWNESTGEIRSGQLEPDAGFEEWLMKFDQVSGNGDHGVKDAAQYTQIEYAYYQMATSAGIIMEECRLYESDGARHFMTRRFDRKNGKKIHMQSLGALAHISYNEPGLCSYEQAARYMRIIGMSMRELEQLYRRMVFNCLAVNQDDHVKNISFLMDRDGTWTLAPAYDLTFAYNSTNRWLSQHQMTVNSKRQRIDENDLLAAGLAMELKKNFCSKVIEEVRAAVTDFPKYAEAAGISEPCCRQIQEVQRREGLLL